MRNLISGLFAACCWPGLVFAAEVDPPNCIALKSVALADEEVAAAESAALFAPYIGQCMDKALLMRVVDDVSNLYMSRGEVTTRAYVKEQDVADGTLEISVLKGILADVVDAKTKQPTWRTRSAFAFQVGRVLNLREIESALETMNRPPSSKVRFDITPGQGYGESVVEIKGDETSRFHLQLGLSGRHNLKHENLSLVAEASVDNPLEINDILTYRYNSSYVQRQYQGNSGSELAYSFPVASYLVELVGSEFAYQQGVQGLNDTYLSEGDTRGSRLRVSKTMWRNQTSKFTPALSVYHKSTENHFAGERVDVSSYSTTLAQLDLKLSQFMPWGQLTTLYSFYRGTDWFGARGDGYLSPDAVSEEEPKLEFRKHSLDVSMAYPIGDTTLSLAANWHLQYTEDRLFNSDQLTVGSDYTVRGYLSRSLYGNNAWYASTNLTKSWPRDLWRGLIKGASLYAGYDYGQVKCEADNPDSCGDVAGAALGADLRGEHLSVGGMLSKPLKPVGEDFKDDVLFKFDLGWRF